MFICILYYLPCDQHRTEIESILALPKVISIMPAYDHESDWMKQVATDCIWSDPASEDMESKQSFLYIVFLWAGCNGHRPSVIRSVGTAFPTTSMALHSFVT